MVDQTGIEPVPLRASPTTDLLAKGLLTRYPLQELTAGHRSAVRWAQWWAHLAFTRINIAPTDPRNQIDEMLEIRSGPSARQIPATAGRGFT